MSAAADTSNVVPVSGRGIPQGSVSSTADFIAAMTAPPPPTGSDLPTAPPAVPTFSNAIVLAPVPALLPTSLSRTTTVDALDLADCPRDEPAMPGLIDMLCSASAPVTAAGSISAPPSGPFGVAASLSASTTVPIPRQAPASHAEQMLESMELSPPIASGTRWSIAVGNTLLQNTHNVAARVARESQMARKRHINVQHRFDSVHTCLDAVINTVRKGPCNDDDSLLSQLANGQNETSATITQLQHMVRDNAIRLRASENNATALNASLGEVLRVLHSVVNHNVLPVPTPAVSTVPTAQPMDIDMVVPTQIPAAAPTAAIAAPLAPAPAPPAPTAAPAVNMQAMFNAFAAALSTWRGHEDNKDADEHNVRHQPEPTPSTAVAAAPVYAALAYTAPAPAPVYAVPVYAAPAPIYAAPAPAPVYAAPAPAPATVYTAPAPAVPAAPTYVAPANAVASLSTSPPAAPDAPSRRPHEPARECIFGPVGWKQNINAGARTIISEGMCDRPNMSHFYTRRGPDSNHIIIGFESPAAVGWFADTWMAQRCGRWCTVMVFPNA